MRHPILSVLLLAGCIGLPPTPVGPQDATDVAVPDSGADVEVATQDVGDDDRDARDVDLDATMDMSSPGFTRFTSIAIATNTACAVADTGRVLCWGRNSNRLLADDGDETARPPSWRGPEFAFDGIDGGAGHFCGIRGNDVQCWGANLSHQGINTPDESLATPRTVVVPWTTAKPLSVSAGDASSCAAFADGKVVCWGSNTNFAIVPGNVGEGLLIPSLVSLAASSVVSTGAHHTCAILNDPGKSVHCWGLNAAQQAVPNNLMSPVEPMAVPRGQYSKIDTGDFSCGVTGDEVQCWGANTDGRLGSMAASDTLVVVPDVGLAIDVALGATHACALTSEGAILCWGGWTPGGPTEPQKFFSPGRPFDGLAAGPQVTCASAGDELYCWGSNADGVAGQWEGDSPSARDFDTPMLVDFGPVTP